MSGLTKVTAALAALILAGSVVAIIWQLWPPGPPRVPTHDWFYDLNTGQLFAGPLGEIPPIDAPSGPLPDGAPAGVRAHVYSCGNCSSNNLKVAWLETYTVENRDILRGPRTLPKTPAEDKPYIPPLQHAPLTMGGGMLLKRPGDEQWVEKNTPAGANVMVVPSCPEGSAPRQCWP